MINIPRQLVSTDPRQLFAAIREIVEFLKALPRIELKTIETATQSAVVLKTEIKNVKGVLLVQAYQTGSPDTTVTFLALVDWRNTADGIKVRIDTAAILHTFTFLIIGDK